MMVGWILFYSSLFHSDVERKVCKCFSLVASLENLASVTGFAGSSCSFLIANALSVHLLAQSGSRVGDGVRDQVGRDSVGLFFYNLLNMFF